jgi:nucleotide-binding universal stress UspA family protein
MADEVLIALEDSPAGWAALEFAAEELSPRTLTLLHVIDPVEGGYSVRTGLQRSSEEWFQAAREDAEALFAEARERVGEGATVETAVEVGRPAKVIVESAEEFDHVVTGSHGRSGVSRILLGSVAETVVRRSPVPVTVVR